MLILGFLGLMVMLIIALQAIREIAGSWKKVGIVLLISAVVVVYCATTALFLQLFMKGLGL